MARQQQLHPHRRIKIGAGIEARIDEAIEAVMTCKAVEARAIKGDMVAEADMVVAQGNGKIKAVVMAEADVATEAKTVNKI